MPMKKIISGDLKAVSVVPQCLDGAWVPAQHHAGSHHHWTHAIRREFNGAMLLTAMDGRGERIRTSGF